MKDKEALRKSVMILAKVMVQTGVPQDGISEHAVDCIGQGRFKDAVEFYEHETAPLEEKP